VRRNIRHRIIVGVEEIPKAEGSNPDEDANRESGIARGFNQEGMPGDDRGNASENRVEREGKGEQ
jgi:hypothetical protein